jgi:predicted N-acetyltransferase YhbS
MNRWLREHAFDNEGRSSRTYVVTDGGDTVIAYYALATGRVDLKELPRRMRHDQPPVVPVILLGRLAVDSEHAGQGIGSHLLKEAMLRTLEVSNLVGVRALIVHAIDDHAADFYRRYGFLSSPTGDYSLILPVETISSAVSKA